MHCPKMVISQTKIKILNEQRYESLNVLHVHIIASPCEACFLCMFHNPIYTNCFVDAIKFISTLSFSMITLWKKQIYEVLLLEATC